LYSWQVLERIEPFGEAAQNLRCAALMCLLAQVWSGKKGRRPKIEDFLRLFEPRREMSTEEMQNTMKSMFGKA
jgi:hypothetical protein